ncbi:MAG: RNA-binding S4 domain-containing protein [Bacteroidota bacterium]|nr:RNA-binding S4 domain-containing protein [Bacteroidota bacterium]
MTKTVEFQLREGESFIPLIQLLKVTQVANSGGESQVLVTEGKVTLNGQPELRKRAKIKAGDVVTAQGYEIRVTG